MATHLKVSSRFYPFRCERALPGGLPLIVDPVDQGMVLDCPRIVIDAERDSLRIRSRYHHERRQGHYSFRAIKNIKKEKVRRWFGSPVRAVSSKEGEAGQRGQMRRLNECIPW